MGANRGPHLPRYSSCFAKEEDFFLLVAVGRAEKSSLLSNYEKEKGRLLNCYILRVLLLRGKKVEVEVRGVSMVERLKRKRRCREGYKKNEYYLATSWE